MSGGLTEAERGALLSTMSTETVALMLGRSEVWVCRQRAALADLPPRLPVQARAAQAAKPWRPDDDAFAPPTPAPVVVRRTPFERPQTWREAGEAAGRKVAEAAPAAPVAPVAPPPVLFAPPPRRWGHLKRPEAADGRERPAVIPPDPAMLAEKHHERMFVRQQRARNVSWFNIANMTGKTVPYLQAQYGEGKL